MATNVEVWATQLKEAFSGIGTDEKKMMDVLLAAKDASQMGALTNHYSKQYPNELSLEDALYDELSGDELKDALHLFYEVSLPPPETETTVDDTRWVSSLFEAFDEWGSTNEQLVMDTLLAAQSVSQMGALTNLYKKQYPNELSLEDALYDELSGDELKAALQLYYRGFVKNAPKEPAAAQNIPVHATVTPQPSKPVTVNEPVQPAPAPEVITPVETQQAFRPGYTGHDLTASKPNVLDFVKTDIKLCDYDDEAEFRKIIVQTLLELDDLGLNPARDNGLGRAEAYLDIVTWDESTRVTFTDNNDKTTSSCGMFIRNLWWLCGARGNTLMNADYKKAGHGKIIALLNDFDPRAKRSWGNGLNENNFFPKIGDVILVSEKKPVLDKEKKQMLDPKTNQPMWWWDQHIFTIYEIDKDIEFVGKQVTVYDKDAAKNLAQQVTFKSIDGGQGDGKDGTNKNWGCQGIFKKERTTLLSDGHFKKEMGTAWPLTNKKGRPIATLIDVWAMKDRFTDNYIKPVRKSRPSPPNKPPPE